jgi:Protein of unknown function (DUF732)
MGRFSPLASMALVVATLFAAPAHADSDTDAKFIQALDVGTVPYTNTHDAIALGQMVCSDLSRGYTYYDAVKVVTEMNHTWTDAQDSYLVGVAVGVYCPDQQGKIPTSH